MNSAKWPAQKLTPPLICIIEKERFKIKHKLGVSGLQLWWNLFAKVAGKTYV